MKYINKYSWKSFLSSQSKAVLEKDGIFCWKTRKNNQLSADHPLTPADLPTLISLAPFNFFYFTAEDVAFLKDNGFSVSARKDPDITIPIKDINLAGRKYKDIRNSINKCIKQNFSIQHYFNDYKDILEMLRLWSSTSGSRKFQDRSGKHKYFFSNNLHKDCINVFVYDKDKLIAFAVISPGDDRGNASYVIGKALNIYFPGLSEYTDNLAYKLAEAAGIEYVSLGGGDKSMRNYKMKFPGAMALESYDGTAKLKEENNE